MTLLTSVYVSRYLTGINVPRLGAHENDTHGDACARERDVSRVIVSVTRWKLTSLRHPHNSLFTPLPRPPQNNKPSLYSRSSWLLDLTSDFNNRSPISRRVSIAAFFFFLFFFFFFFFLSRPAEPPTHNAALRFYNKSPPTPRVPPCLSFVARVVCKLSYATGAQMEIV